MRHWSLASLALLVGCTDGEATTDSADLNAAAKRAERDIAGYAAARPGASKLAAFDMPPTVSARYRCGAATMTVEFDNVAQNARVWLDRGKAMTLRQQPAASGIHYAAGGYSLRGSGREAVFDGPGRRGVDCHVIP
ncbi:membrane-bound inhibitor of C-type lysozyme [Sphingomonas jinjuensis]|uniref:Membrane-bound inhibitor of C-type lysozyme n=1 Tax=Sphingomonas jinjuensis TaxID=535907 RepID=A0A840FHJ1_9SPHN|nr:MliC family protein [Sphingomonas jinjuensis]MBB4155184.1 membrane-bound inhibitor of C-type lysozyme [Sphingomonas jinjuensis]